MKKKINNQKYLERLEEVEDGLISISIREDCDVSKDAKLYLEAIETYTLDRTKFKAKDDEDKYIKVSEGNFVSLANLESFVEKNY